MKESFFRSEDAVSEVVAVISILGILTIGIAVISLTGAPILQNAHELAMFQNVEQSFTALDSRVSKMTLGESPVQFTQIKAEKGTFNVSNNSWMNITLKDDNETIMTSINVSLGALEFSYNLRTVAYENGGVWAKYSDGSQTMISPPEFHYASATLTLPLIRLRGNFTSGGGGFVTLSASANEAPTVYFPSSTANRTNPLTQGSVWITVRSDYCDAWLRYWEEQASVSVQQDDCATNNTVTLELSVPETPLFQNAVSATNKLYVRNSAVVDSYNSSLEQKACGTWTPTSKGDVYANILIQVENSASIDGDAMSASEIKMKNPQSRITGNAYGSISYSNGASSSQILGSRYSAVGSVSFPSIDGTVDSNIAAYSASNNNAAEADCITGNQISLSASACTLATGNYYLTKFQVQQTGGKVTFDTSGGPINIAIEDGSTFDVSTGNPVLEVTGANPVKFYIGSGVSATFSNGAKVQTYQSNTTLFRLYVNSGANKVTFDQSTNFTGIVYAPGLYATQENCVAGANGIVVDNSALICGALVGGTVNICNAQKVHFDETLANLSEDTSATIQFLHISENTLDINV